MKETPRGKINGYVVFKWNIHGSEYGGGEGGGALLLQPPLPFCAAGFWVDI